MLGQRGHFDAIFCDFCEKPCRQHVTVSVRVLRGPLEGKARGWSWYEGHLRCFRKYRVQQYKRGIKVGQIKRWCQG